MSGFGLCAESRFQGGVPKCRNALAIQAWEFPGLPFAGRSGLVGGGLATGIALTTQAQEIPSLVYMGKRGFMDLIIIL